MGLKSIFPIILSGFLLAASCSTKNRQGSHDASSGSLTTIEGTLDNGQGKQVVLDEMKAREFVPVDTVTCNDNNFFIFRFPLQSKGFYALRTGGKGYITLLANPGDSIRISGIYGETYPYSVTGSEDSELLNQLATHHKKALNEMGEISRKNREMMNRPDYSSVKRELDYRFDSIAAAFYDYSRDFIYEHPGSLSILVALYNMYGPGLPVFQPEYHMKVYEFVDSVLYPAYGKIDAVELLHRQVAEFRLTKESGAKTGQRLHKGETAPDFVSSGPDGEKIALSDLRGNYVLLAFWAGWSELSRAENPYLREAWKLYHEKGLEIVQVSLDDNQEEWTDAIRDDQLKWYQVSELNRWDSEIASLYFIERIPSNFLISPEGKILETDLFENQLLVTLKNIFNE